MITFDHVTKRYGERLALDSVSWHMEEGESLVFLGKSGAGKTTLLRLITHEIQPTSGRIVVGTFHGSHLGRHQRALLRRTLGIIYEDFRLLDDRTVFENVALAVHITGRFRDEDVVPPVQLALEEVGLRELSGAFPRELSAGEKQRCAIARAIVNRPAVILADEPTGALEPASASEILERLRAIHTEGAALILVTTRREVAAALPGRVLEIDRGAIVSGDSPGRAHVAVPLELEEEVELEEEGFEDESLEPAADESPQSEEPEDAAPEDGSAESEEFADASPEEDEQAEEREQVDEDQPREEDESPEDEALPEDSEEAQEGGSF